jgi:hypothetical protein
MNVLNVSINVKNVINCNNAQNVKDNSKIIQIIANVKILFMKIPKEIVKVKFLNKIF